MALGSDASLLLRIKGDASDAIRALKDTESGAKSLTGATSGMSAGFAAMAGPAAIAATVIAGIGAAALAVTSKLFDLSKAAADYGSAIYDASQKTGLATETMSALKIAAEQSGSSFEGVTNAVSKFNVLIGQAAAGNEKAEKVLKQYGITATDTQGALEEAVSVIAGMSSASDQAAAAAALFKDRTGEILPVIKSFDGNLPELITKLRAMGLLLSEEDAKAADKFGDQMDTLNAQLTKVAHQIGFAVMPVFLKFANSLSTWLVENQVTVKAWANTIGTAFTQVSQFLLKLYDDSRRVLAALQAIAVLTAQGPAGLGQAITIAQAAESQIQSDIASRNQPVAADGSAATPRTGVVPDTGDSAKAPKVNTINVDRADSQRKVNEDALEFYKQTLEREYALWSAQQETILAQTKANVQAKLETEAEYQARVRAFEVEAANGKLANLQLEKAKREELGLSTLEVDHKIALQEAELEKQFFEHREKRTKLEEEDRKKELEHLEKKRESWAEHIRQLERVQELEDIEQQRRYEEQAKADRKKFESESAGGALEGGIFDSLPHIGLQDVFGSNDELQTQADFIKGVWTDLEGHIGGAIGSMVNGLAQMAAAWIATGHFSAKAALQMASSIALSLAMQAGVAAIMEVARGWAESAAAAASAAIFDYHGAALHGAAASMHFAAAAIYGTVAGVAAVVGVGLGLGARALGGDKAGGGGGSRSSTASTQSSHASNHPDNQGEAYSSRKDGLIEQGRNAPTINLVIEDRSDGFAQLFKTSIERNGPLRQTLKDAVEG